MFEVGPDRRGDTALAGLVATLADLDQDVHDSVRVDRIRLLEVLKSAAAAAQAKEVAAFAASQRAEQGALGVPVDRIGRGVAAQVGLARRISPFQARRYLGWANILTSELPNTFAALQGGRVSEWRAMIVARETAWLSRADRVTVDAQLADQLETLGDRRVEAEAKKLAYRLDPQGYLGRIRGAESDRHVGLRPAPDTMARLTGFLPVAQGVAAYAALRREADTLISQGDPRGRGQIMADTMVERITGQAQASEVPVEINLIMTDATLFAPGTADGDEPAHLVDAGTIPAHVARGLALDVSDRAPRWLRRLYTEPTTGELAAMDSHRRSFTANQRRFLRLRDQYCRTSWCEAPIRHADHVVPAEHSGPTSVANGQGYCEACNYAKQAPGWRTRLVVGPAGAAEVEIITPTRHRYRSRPPDPPGRRVRCASRVEATLLELLRDPARAA
ncbi:MAG TPA: DUF222 domain-containing protein [Jatrophihabitans sp.]|jgi:hypothetical protein|nr:DUF222 domain-containing protein [Jatrophihabitans sp.]